MSDMWAPQSPDLSTRFAPDDDDTDPVHPQHHGFRGSVSLSLPYSPPASSPTLLAKTLPSNALAMPRGTMHDGDGDYVPDEAQVASGDMARGKAVKREDNGAGAAAFAAAPAAPLPDVNITVHFPVARIKRIMQADDDVGKVAQVTPVVVSKALELFMVSLVTKSAAEAKARSSKRVAAVHLKQAIANDPQFDFLSDIVAKVADAPAAAADKSEDAMDVDGAKKKKTSSRRKKKSDDDDF